MTVPERKIVKPPFIKLDSFLKFVGAGYTGGMCKEIILAGKVKVSGEVCTARGKKLYDGALVEIETDSKTESYLVVTQNED